MNQAFILDILFLIMCHDFCVAETWYLVEWEGENGDFTPVPHKWLVDGQVPSEGDRVKVRERATKKIYEGLVIKKGIFIYSCCIV